jgi:hypothetical protein
MNWATIAPDTRLYKGKNLFRWEVSPGLGEKRKRLCVCDIFLTDSIEHHCGTCATPLHSTNGPDLLCYCRWLTLYLDSRAKTSCIGKHVEPCYRFHQQLHFVGEY